MFKEKMPATFAGICFSSPAIAPLTKMRFALGDRSALGAEVPAACRGVWRMAPRPASAAIREDGVIRC